MKHTTQHGMRLRIPFLLSAFLLIATQASAQDYYVCPDCGSNWNDGSPGAPWQTVDFALNGPQAPLPQCSTIHLYGANNSYCPSSGESFPWELYNDVSLVADVGGCCGPNHVVDAGGVQTVIQYDPSQDFTNSNIRGLTLKNGVWAIDAMPAATEHSPLIEDCTIEQMSTGGIRFNPTSASTVQPTIRGCTFKNLPSKCIRINGIAGSVLNLVIRDNVIHSTTTEGDSIVQVGVDGCTADGCIEGNQISWGLYGNVSGIRLTGVPLSGLIVVARNNIEFAGAWAQFYGKPGRGIYLDWYSGQVDCSDNAVLCTRHGFGLVINSCNPWHPSSRIADNECAATHGAHISDCAAILVQETQGVVLTSNDCRGYLGSNHGYGIHLKNADDATVEGNICHNNPADGILVNGDSTNVTIRSNASRDNGGNGIRAYRGCLVADNLVEANWGAGLRVDSAGMTVEDNEIRCNYYSGVSEGICQSSLYSRNIVVLNNGCGFSLYATSTSDAPRLMNNTIVANGNSGVSSNLPSTLGPYVTNCVIWDNAGCDIAGLAFGQYTYCDIGSCGSPGNGNISTDPLFVVPPGDCQQQYDCHLQPGSPCIDAGDPFGPSDPDCTLPDMGAFYIDHSPMLYCTAKVNSLSCTPSIGFSGSPSATAWDPFEITATQVINNKNGIFFYGTSGPNGAPFQGGFLCVQPPIKRTPLQGSGGNPPPNDCSGTFSFDFNAWIQSGSDSTLAPGVQVNGQYWYRDPQSPSTTGLTDAIEFLICP